MDKYQVQPTIDLVFNRDRSEGIFNASTKARADLSNASTGALKAQRVSHTSGVQTSTNEPYENKTDGKTKSRKKKKRELRKKGGARRFSKPEHNQR